MPLKLHNSWNSSCSYRVRIALNLKAVDWEYISVKIKVGERFQSAYMETNPVSMVPVLEHFGDYLTESMPICEYLEEIFPDSGYPLLSRTCADERYEVRRLCEIINSGT